MNINESSDLLGCYFGDDHGEAIQVFEIGFGFLTNFNFATTRLKQQLIVQTEEDTSSYTTVITISNKCRS